MYKYGCISEEYYLHWYEIFGEAQNKAMRDYIIPLWRVVIPNMVSESCLNLVMSIEFLNIEQKIVNLEGVVKSD